MWRDCLLGVVYLLFETFAARLAIFLRSVDELVEHLDFYPTTSLEFLGDYGSRR